MTSTSGFTLLEVLMAVVVTSMLCTGIYSLMFSTSKAAFESETIYSAVALADEILMTAILQGSAQGAWLTPYQQQALQKHWQIEVSSAPDGKNPDLLQFRVMVTGDTLTSPVVIEKLVRKGMSGNAE